MIQLKKVPFYLSVLPAILFSALVQAGEISEQTRKDLHLDKLNQTAPDFAVTDQKMLSDYKGDWVVLHFWATWCSSCRQELPALEKLYQHRDSNHVKFITVSIDEKNRENVQAFINKLDLHMPVVFGMDTQISDSYWSWGVPVTYLINPRGRIVARALGPRDWNSMAGDELLTSLTDTENADLTSNLQYKN